MSMGFVAAGVAAAGAIGGAYISSKSNEKIAKGAAAAAQFSPFNIQTGNVSTGAQIDPETGQPIQGTFQGELNAPLSSAQTQLNTGVLGGVIGGPGQGFDRGFQANRFRQGTIAAESGARDLISGIEQQDRELQFQQGQLGQGLAQFQQAGRGAAGLVGDTSQFAAQRGQELLGQDFGDVRGQELALLRSQARPGEDRAVNAKFQNLFSRGQLGTTGGANQIEALASAQENADIGRQLAATQTAQGLLSQNQATGQGLLGLGQQGGALQGNLASQQLGGLQTNLGAQGSLGQQRLAGAQSLFGFGQNLRGLGLAESGANLGLSSALEEQNRAALNLSGTFGGAQATAGGNVSQALLSQQGNTFGGAVGGALSQFGTDALGQILSNNPGGSTPELQQITLPDSAVRRG